MVTEISMGKIQAHITLSGYIYINLPQYLARQFNISAKTYFIAYYKDGRLMLLQEETNAT